MDSVAAAALAVEEIRGEVPGARILLLYIERPLAYPENLRYIERLGRWLGVELVVARPSEGLEAIARRGWPTPMRRWCMYRWKLEPMMEAVKRYPRPHLHVIGVRRSESRRRQHLYSSVGDGGGAWWYCLRHASYCAWYWGPILDWTREDVRRFIREEGIPRNPLWSSGDGHGSPDCMICLAYAKEKDYLRLKAEHPDVWRRILEVYRKVNAVRRRAERILAWGKLDLERVEAQRSVESYLGGSEE
jgi:3'-phosphoadenosine 5'-phosphosulfate sulfotransferase (PAPS reductase)/FAD synthetase